MCVLKEREREGKRDEEREADLKNMTYLAKVPPYSSTHLGQSCWLKDMQHHSFSETLCLKWQKKNAEPEKWKEMKKIVFSLALL